MNWYYDNQYVVDDSTQTITIDRVYQLSLGSFSEDDWIRLERIYKSLPGWVGYGSPSDPGLPYWFGNNEEIKPFLWASLEPQGIQVHGCLTLADWQLWSAHFEDEALQLPHYEI